MAIVVLSERIYVLASSEIHDLATMAKFAMVAIYFVESIRSVEYNIIRA